MRAELRKLARYCQAVVESINAFADFLLTGSLATKPLGHHFGHHASQRRRAVDPCWSGLCNGVRTAGD
jgi:hypothetical protein